MNENLPIFSHRDEIVKTINYNPVTIITAETGSGKSTQVCQYLYEDGYEVIITEPRRLAAVSLANRVSEEMDDTSNLVGYHTGFEREFSQDTKILFCTDGLHLVKELLSETKIEVPVQKVSTMERISNIFNKSSEKHKEVGMKKVLILDEVHEWNLNIETLVAWVKKEIKGGWDTKVVIMSATIDHDDLSVYFNNAPVISVGGSLHPVETTQKGSYELIDSIKHYSQRGRNILVFVPGKTEIYETINKLDNMDVIILPLHGHLTLDEQKLCFREYDKPKIIVSTNVAQTSVTVPCIDTVIDTGTERRIETNKGVQGLFLKNISQADCIQRKGRAGRTKPGVYVLCSSRSIKDRPLYTKPEIQRLILDQMVLRLMSNEIDATELEFFHQPEIKSIVAAKTSLKTIGAIDEHDITILGRRLLDIPVSTKHARMIIEANELGVVDDVITIVAILEVGSLLNSKNIRYRYFTEESNSDLLAELDVWNEIRAKKVDFKNGNIMVRNYFRIKELREKIIDSVKRIGTIKLESTGNREDIVQSCLMGMLENVYVSSYGEYVNGIDASRYVIDDKSCTNSRSPKFVVGNPITIEFKKRYFSETLNLLKSITIVNIEWVEKYLPGTIREELDDDIRYCKTGDACYSYKSLYFRDIMISQTREYYENHPMYEYLKEEYFDTMESTYTTTFNHPMSSNVGLGYERDTDEQKSVSIEGYKFNITGGNRFHTVKRHITLNKDDIARLSGVGAIKLDNGDLISLMYHGRRFENLQSIRDIIDRDLVKHGLYRIESHLPTISSTKYNVIKEELFPYVKKIHLAKLLNGEDVYGYIHLITHSKKVKVVVSKSEEFAKNSMTETMPYIFDLVVNEKYPYRRFEFKIDGRWTLTSKGSGVHKEFMEFVNECRKEITFNTIDDYLELIDDYFEEVIIGLNDS